MDFSSDSDEDAYTIDNLLSVQDSVVWDDSDFFIFDPTIDITIGIESKYVDDVSNYIFHDHESSTVPEYLMNMAKALLKFSEIVGQESECFVLRQIDRHSSYDVLRILVSCANPVFSEGKYKPLTQSMEYNDLLHWGSLCCEELFFLTTIATRAKFRTTLTDMTSYRSDMWFVSYSDLRPFYGWSCNYDSDAL